MLLDFACFERTAGRMARMNRNFLVDRVMANVKRSVHSSSSFRSEPPARHSAYNICNSVTSSSSFFFLFFASQ